MRCSSLSTVIFLIVSKEIQKYDQRKFYFFSEKKNFQIWYSRSSLKKKSQKNLQIFFRTPKLQNKKIRNKQNFEWKIPQNTLFRKHQIQKKFAEILWKQSSQKYFCEKNNFRQKNFDNKNFHQKKICRKKFS